MIDPRSLRGQLALAYAVALLIALIAFAVATLALVDRTQRTTLDDRLQLAAGATAAIVDEKHGRLRLDTKDRQQFQQIVGRRLDGAIVQRDGTVVFSTGTRLPPEVVALGTARAIGTQTIHARGSTLRVTAIGVPAGRDPLGVAIVWADLDGVVDLDEKLAIVFALAIPLVAVFAIGAGSLVAARGLRPLTSLAEIASEIEAHDLSRRIAIPTRDDELGRLCVTFDRMLDRLQSAFDRERRFTSDASHELRAPLSVIRAETDLMLRRMRTPEEYERAMRSIAEQADDLEALTRDLLAAARGENGGSDALARVDVAAVADDAVQRLDRLAHTRGVTIARSADPFALVAGDAPALRRTAICVLHNALKYARDGGTVTVTVRREGARVTLGIADDGPGFSDDALAHATERFWRDDPARARAAADEASGSGLGLSIAAAIVAASRGTLRITNRPEGGALVVITLPALDVGVASVVP